MKRFFVMILLVSTFFIGIGSIVDRVGASLKSDARALELIRLSRIAIGGEANINNVRSMTIAAKTTHFFDKQGATATEPGSLELSMQLPNQFSKKVRIGDPGENSGDGAMRKRIEVTIVKDADGNVITEDISGEPNKRVMKMKSGDGNETWTDENGKTIKIDGDAKVILKKDDTEMREVGNNVIIIKERDGNSNTWTSKDSNFADKNVIIENHSGSAGSEMLRTMLALLLTAPEGTDVDYAYAGEGMVDGNSCNIVLARSGGSEFKLYLDRSTYLPRMMSYQSEMPHIVQIRKNGAGDIEEEEVVTAITDESDGNSVEGQLKFSDFRPVTGLLLPYRWEESVGGMQRQTIEVTGFEINPANISDKFKDENGLLRQVEEQ